MAKFILGIIACLFAFYFLHGGTLHDLFTFLAGIGSHIADSTVQKVRSR